MYHHGCYWCIMNLAHAWWVSIKALLALLEEETVSSAFRCGNYRLLCCRIVSNHASGISIPLSVLTLIGWGLVNSPFNSTRVPVRVSVNKLNLVPERKMPSLIGMFRNGWGLSSLKPYIPIVLLKRKCSLISSRIANSWHMMKKSGFLIFRPEISYGGLRNLVIFFLEIFFWTPGGVKNTKNWHNACLQVNFALFNSHQLKPCLSLEMGCLRVYNVFEPSKTSVN